MATDTQCVNLMPANRRAFALTVFERLGGSRSSGRSLSSIVRRRAQAAEQERQVKLDWLAGQSLRLLQLEEGMGHQPELKKFGASAFEYRSAVLADNPAEAWQRFITAARAAKASYVTAEL